MPIILNGGIASLDEAGGHLNHVDGVMLGRTAYETPWILSNVDDVIFDKPAGELTRRHIVQAIEPYFKSHIKAGVKAHAITRHMLGLFHGCPGARQWRRYLTETAPREPTNPDILQGALSLMPDSVLDMAA